VNWEAVTAISTAFTGLVILLTALFAARQVQALNNQSKAMSAQIGHLRRATQLTGTLSIFDEIMTPEIVDAWRFVMTEFPEKMKDERFHAEALERTPDFTVHKEVYILRHFERIGTLVRNGLVDSDVLLDFVNLFIRENWEKLRPLVLEQRRRYGATLWENFEYLASVATATDAETSQTGVSAVRRDRGSP
jgi:hypothetical protein